MMDMVCKARDVVPTYSNNKNNNTIATFVDRPSIEMYNNIVEYYDERVRDYVNYTLPFMTVMYVTNNKTSTENVATCFACDMLLVIKSSVELNRDLLMFIESNRDVERTNFAGQFFIVVSDDKRELFVDLTYTLNEDTDRVGTLYGGAVKIVEIGKRDLDGYPLRAGDTVEVRGRVAVSGTYVVSSLKKLENKVIMTSPPVYTGKHTLRRVHGSVYVIFDDNTNHSIYYVPALRVTCTRVQDNVYTINNSKITSINSNNEERARYEKYHVKSVCVGDEHVKIKELCESRGVGTWDRPCEADNECPFVDGNGRGACMDSGYCEMPIGVRRLSFKKYAGACITPECPFLY
jgi:hypothetical protein